MAKKQWANIIMVTFNNGECRYVTDIPERNYAEWKVGKPAKEFAMSTAKDIVFGLTVNGYYAVIMTVPVTLLYMYRNSDTTVTEDEDGKKVHCMQYKYNAPDKDAESKSEKSED